MKQSYILPLAPYIIVLASSVKTLEAVEFHGIEFGIEIKIENNISGHHRDRFWLTSSIDSPLDTSLLK